MISVMLGLVLAFVHWGYVCVFFIASSLSISQSVLFGDILCLTLVTILHWGITPSSGSSDVLQTFLTAHSISWPLWVVILGHTPVLEFIDSLLQISSLLILSLDLCELSYWGIPPSLSSLMFCRLFSLLDLFLDLCESSYWGIPLFRVFLLWHFPLFEFATSRADFMVVRPILSIFTSYHLGHPPYCHCLGHPPIFVLFRASPYFRIHHHRFSSMSPSFSHITTIDFHLWAFSVISPP